MNSKKLTRFSIVTSMYIVLTLSIPFLSYGPLQFRFSEIITLLAFIDPFYVGPLTLGCAIANIWSPMGIFDIIFGTLATYLTTKTMSKTKNIYLASLLPSLFSIIIGLEILFVSNEPINLFIVTGQIMFSEFVIVSLIGVPVFKTIMKNNFLMNILYSKNLNDNSMRYF